MALCIVAATGRSLTPETAELTRGHEVIAVNDAYKRIPWAQSLYAADPEWWIAHEGAPTFQGRRLMCRSKNEAAKREELSKRYGIELIPGRRGAGFSMDPKIIHFGSSSAFQATNIAIHRGASPIILIGLDMRGDHFFGEHPKPLRKIKSFETFKYRFREAALMHKDLKIINATPGSALGCFPIMTLQEALNESRNA